MAKEAPAAAAAEKTEKKTRGPQKAAPTSVLLYIENGEPHIFASSRNGHKLITKFQEAQEQGKQVFVRMLEPEARAKSE